MRGRMANPGWISCTIGPNRVDREIAAERKRQLAPGPDFRRPGAPAQGPGEAAAKDTDQDIAKDDEADGSIGEKPDPKESA